MPQWSTLWSCLPQLTEYCSLNHSYGNSFKLKSFSSGTVEQHDSIGKYVKTPVNLYVLLCHDAELLYVATLPPTSECLQVYPHVYILILAEDCRNGFLGCPKSVEPSDLRWATLSVMRHEAFAMLLVVSVSLFRPHEKVCA